MNDLNQQQGDNFKDKILDKIRKNEIHMRPKAYFIIKVVLMVLVVLGILTTSSLLVSYILFSINISGQLFLLGFGGRGIEMFILLFPWKILIMAIILVLILDWLLKQFRFGYRSPLLYLLSGVLVVSIFAGMLVNAAQLHQFLLKQTKEKSLPPVIGVFYEHVRRPSERRDVVRGIVSSVEVNTFEIEAEDDIDSGVKKVFPPPGMRVVNFLQVGDMVFVAGDDFGNEIHAYGIKKIEP